MSEKKSRECDLVLEGGVTSAVIYAGLIARLSQTYGFKCVGGTSAGAVAAAAAAIAERARHLSGNSQAFEGLAGFPAELAATDKQGRTALFNLFQPQRGARAGFRVVTAALRQGATAGAWRPLAAAAWAALCNFPVAALVGAFPGLWLLAITARSTATGAFVWPDGLSVAFGSIGALAGGVVSALLWGTFSTLRAMKANHFGLCNGMPAPGHGGAAALTPQLHALYNRLFGRDPSNPPVTFGDLWGAPGEDRDIELQMITTSLTLARPLRLPNDPDTDPLRTFFYDPREWEQLFPAVVMEWLRTHPRAENLPRVRSEAGQVLAALPEPRQWPVVMAVRLSLSFPGLLSAVPMYTLDGADGVRAVESQPGNVEFVAAKVYFSDGGITSNCPIQLFDAPLPGRPTFGVNLFRTDVDKHGSQPVIWMHGDGSDPQARVNPFATRGTLRAALGFVMAIVDTAIDWRDGVQRGLPGYRERMIHIGLAPRDGGLNLAMPPPTIARLARAGAQAAERLVSRFDLPSSSGLSGWEVHRWVRMRSTLTATRQHLRRLGEKIGVGTPPFARLTRTSSAPLPAFAEPVAALQAEVLMDGVVALSAAVDAVAPAAGLAGNSPQPAPALRMSSPW